MSPSCRLALTTAFAGLLLGASAQDNPPTAVGVFLDFDSPPAQHAVKVMEREVERILQPAGLSVNWRFSRENRGTEAYKSLAYFRFKGRCRAENRTLPAGNFGSLGEVTTLAATRVAAGRVLPFGEVRCDEVRKALAYIRPGTGLMERQGALGLALARVVAHELYHILARTTAHDATGLAKAAQPLDELIAPREIHFEPRETEAIRNSMLGN